MIEISLGEHHGRQGGLGRPLRDMLGRLSLQGEKLAAMARGGGRATQAGETASAKAPGQERLG